MKNADQMVSDIYDKIFENKIKSFDKLTRPIELSEVIEKFELDYFDTKNKSIEEFLDSIDTDEMKFYASVENLIPLTDRLNPHLKKNPFEKYYYKGEKAKPLEHLVTLDNLLKKRKGKKEIELIEVSKTRGGVFQIGEKGSGKTITQNYWIHKNNKIFEKNKIFWVRLDAGKLINLWRYADKEGKEPTITTKDYLIGQMIYVFCKHFKDIHSDKSDLFIEIAKKLNDSERNIIFINDSTKNERDENSSTVAYLENKAIQKNIRTIIEMLSYYEVVITKDEKTFASETERRSVNTQMNRTKSFFIESVLKKAIKEGKNKGILPIWLELGEILRDFLCENGYYLFFIIDGVDNINFYFKEKRLEYLDNILIQLFDFPLNGENAKSNELLMISMRDTSLERMKKIHQKEYYKDTNIYKNIDNFRIIRQENKNLHKPILDKRIDCVNKLTREYQETIMSKILNVIKNHNVIHDEKRWGGNFRCFLHNHLSLAKLITFRYYFFNQPNDFDIEKQMRTFENINFLLNGKLYLDSITNEPSTNKGDNILNIFGEKKYPLIYTRILQVIKKEKPKKHELFSILESTFNYDESILEDCIDKMISCVMIKSTYTYQNASSKYTITEKGDYMLKQFYNDIHFLYFSCLDTFVPVYSPLN